MQLEFQKLTIKIQLRLAELSYSQDLLRLNIKNSYGTCSLYHKAQLKYCMTDYFLVTTKTPIPIAETTSGIIQEAVRCEPLTSSAVLSVIPPWPPTRSPT